ncbi:FmdB family zinc ribbon protein [Cellulomonas xiejunii]|uniref:FmdB family transcriptional regulator n=1 Tax=Cellulomonas xiejunii TaxID=2968083 RepID=A0ABY5KSH0_9CELL|nr:FmdB family zinc ribbon protein [Cellulomonas xiejunii]MCC2322655.1 FmdB family transcriptional regulator [Cellulomonas xiejunii]UUI72693.1 FmdB family transcriptional regulator [Cellulomonas xiejunii]
MPTYAYRCTACEHSFEVQQSFTDDALSVCPECEGRLRKVFSTVGVVFKGSGFYRNDARTGSSTSGSGGKSGASTSSSTSTSSDTSVSTSSGSTTSSSTSGTSSAGSTGSSSPATTSPAAASA